MSYRSGHHSEYLSTIRMTMQVIGPPPGRHQPSRRGCRPAAQDGYTWSMPQAGPVRAGGILDRDRTVTALGIGRPRRQPILRSVTTCSPAHRAPGGDAVRLRGPDRGTAGQGGPHHQPPVADQEQFDQKLEQVMRRQTTLESRATALGRSGCAGDGSIKPSSREPPRRTRFLQVRPSLPISDTVIFVAPRIAKPDWSRGLR